MIATTTTTTPATPPTQHPGFNGGAFLTVDFAVVGAVLLLYKKLLTLEATMRVTVMQLTETVAKLEVTLDSLYCLRLARSGKARALEKTQTDNDQDR